MFPTDPHRDAWEQTAIRLALNASSTDADATSATVVDGKPLSAWIASPNLHGDIVMPAGQDWISKDFQHLDYLSILSTRFADADASVLESRALQTVAQRQATHQNGSILNQPELGYESMLVKRIAASWWNHKLFGPSPAPTESEFDTSRAKTAGVTEFPSVDVIAARWPGASAFMSWDSERPMGLWIPGEQAHPGDPIFTYYAPGSLIGSATGTVSAYTCKCADDRFSTAQPLRAALGGYREWLPGGADLLAGPAVLLR